MSPEKANILRQVADGRSYKELAADVGTTEQVIKNIIHILCRRNGAPNRVNLIAMALRKGTISWRAPSRESRDRCRDRYPPGID